MKTWFDPILLIGLFISIGVSVTMFLTGNDTINSMIVGFLSTIVTLLVDIIARIQKVESTILEANNLSKLFSDERLANALREIAHNYATLKDYKFDHYIKIADTRIAECKTQIRELASGSIFAPAKSIYEYSAYSAFEQAAKSVKAIDRGPASFWNTERGRKYLESNRAAVKRGIKVVRIFALTGKDANQYVDILKEQVEAGIDVIITNPNRINQEFLIVDDRIRIDIEQDNDGQYFGEHIILDAVQVSEAVERFKLLASFGKKIQDLALNTQ